MKNQILAVIVLYGIEVDRCVTYHDLLRAAARVHDKQLPLYILLYDNSPEARRPSEVPSGTFYYHAERNAGVAGAYNYALQLALDRKCDWMLTLDQDTNLPERFLQDLLPCAASLTPQTRFGAIVPQVFHGTRMISPYTFTAGAWPRFFPSDFFGEAGKPVFAINSGSLLRTAALVQIGGYDPMFWLDASDHVLFSRLAKAGLNTYVMGGLRLQQTLSVLDETQPLSSARLRSMLSSESAFWDLERSRIAGLMFTLLRIRHLVGMVRRREAPEQRALVLRSIMDRILHRRRSRLELWRRRNIAGSKDNWGMGKTMEADEATPRNAHSTSIS